MRRGVDYKGEAGRGGKLGWGGDGTVLYPECGHGYTTLHLPKLTEVFSKEYIAMSKFY